MKRDGLLIVLTFVAIVLGSCVGIEAHEPDGGVEPEPCDVTTVSIKAGVERVPSPERTSPALMPPTADTTVVWHCGTPDEPPPVIANAASFFHPYAQRAPPRR